MAFVHGYILLRTNIAKLWGLNSLICKIDICLQNTIICWNVCTQIRMQLSQGVYYKNMLKSCFKKLQIYLIYAG